MKREFTKGESTKFTDNDDVALSLQDLGWTEKKPKAKAKKNGNSKKSN